MSATQIELGKVAQFINGAAFKPEDWGDEGKKIIRIQNLTDPSKPYNKTLRQVDSKLVVERGDLLVSWSATLGVFEWADEDAVLNQHIFRVVPDLHKVDKNYLKHSLENAITEMDKHLHGATMKHINRGEFLATKIPLPPLEEQQRIAAILDKAAQIKAKREQAIAKLDELAQSTFVEMFGDVNGKNMSSAKLQDICEFKYGKPLPEKNRAGGDINVFGSNGVVGLHNQSLTTGETIIIGRKGSFGEINFCETSCYPIDTTFYIDKTATKQNLTWLRFALSRLGLNKMNKSAAVPGLSREDAYRQQLMVPELVEQVSFENKIKAIKRQVKIQYSSLKGVDALTASLQHRAFTTGFAA